MVQNEAEKNILESIPFFDLIRNLLRKSYYL